MDLILQGKNILITGGSKGIGKVIAEVLLEEGANVSIAARDLEVLKKAKEDLGGKVSIFQVDVTKADQREKLMQDFIEEKGSIDVLINNAGGSNGGLAAETPMELFYEAMELNYFSAVHLSKLAAEKMKQTRSGSIINITSVFGRESGGKVTYNNAKAALISFTKSFADEMIPFGIRVNSVAQGAFFMIQEIGKDVWKRIQSESCNSSKMKFQQGALEPLKKLRMSWRS